MKLDVEQMVDWNESFCPLTQSKPATFEVGREKENCS